MISGYSNINRKLQETIDKGVIGGQEGNFNIRAGLVDGVERGFCHGFHLGINSATHRLLAPNALTTGVVDYTPIIPTATIIRLSSTDANDTSAGTGARFVLLVGLDADYNPQVEVIAMNGLTPVASVNTFKAINEMQVISAGTSFFNEGDIYATDNVDTVTGGIPQTTIFFGMETGWSLGQTATFTVKAGYTALMTWYASTSTSSATNPSETCAHIRVQDAVGGSGVDIVAACLFLDTGYGQFNLYNAPPIPEKSTFYITVNKSGGGGAQTAGTYWHINLVKNSIYGTLI